MKKKLSIKQQDKLSEINHRLYCVWQAIEHGEKAMYTHEVSTTFSLYKIWDEINDLLKAKDDD
jgi:hypothetical protein